MTRPNTVCLLMEQFGSLPDESEFVEWMENTVFKDSPGELDEILEGFKCLNIDLFRKRFLLTFEEDKQAKTMLAVADNHGQSGILWPGLEREVRVRAYSMDEVVLEIIVMDVAPETDEELVKRTLEKYGRVKRCERMTLPAGRSNRWAKTKVGKVKVELVRNSEELPNIIHALGTGHSADDFVTWKLQYRGCPRYCFGCGAASHLAWQCPEHGITREVLENSRSVVGEEVEEEAVEEAGALKMSYAAVVKDPSFLEKKRLEKQERAEAAETARVVEERKQEEKRAKDAEEETLIAEEEVHLARAQERLLVSGDQDQVPGEFEKVDGLVVETETGGLAISNKRPAPAPTSPCPADKSPRVRQEGEDDDDPSSPCPTEKSPRGRQEGEDDEEETSEEDDDQSEEGGERSSPEISVPSTMAGPAPELGQGVRVMEGSLQDGGSQDN